MATKENSVNRPYNSIISQTAELKLWIIANVCPQVKFKTDAEVVQELAGMNKKTKPLTSKGLDREN
jgi:hypothetical protein